MFSLFDIKSKVGRNIITQRKLLITDLASRDLIM